MGARKQGLPYEGQDWFKDHTKGNPRTVLSDTQLAFIEFLLDPNSSISQTEWCRQNGVDPTTGTRWKKTKLFRDEWEKRAYEVYGGPEKVNKIVESVYQAATGGDMKAAQLYLQYVDKFTPKREIVTPTKQLEEMSDDELAELGENIVALRKAR